MFCQKCGNQIPDGSTSCNFCGAPQQAQPSAFEGGFQQPVQPVTPPPVQPVQPVQPVPPVTPPPAPKKKNNILLIILIAVLAVGVIIGAIFIANPDILDSGSSSSQSEEKDDDDDKKDKKKDKDTNSDEDEEEEYTDEDVDSDSSYIDVDDAESALDDVLDTLTYDSSSYEAEDILTYGEGYDSLSSDEYNEMMVYMEIFESHFNYEIVDSYSIDDETVGFTVNIQTVDYDEVIGLLYSELETNYDYYSNLSEEELNDELVDILAECVAYSESVVTEIEFEVYYDDYYGEWSVDISPLIDEFENGFNNAMSAYEN